MSAMNDELNAIQYERRRCVEAAVFALVLAEDWPWRADELAHRLGVPADVIGLAVAMLRADGSSFLTARRWRVVGGGAR